MIQISFYFVGTRKTFEHKYGGQLFVILKWMEPNCRSHWSSKYFTRESLRAHELRTRWDNEDTIKQGQLQFENETTEVTDLDSKGE